MQVAASAAFEQVPFFITTCDYTLIGEEIFAAGAYLSEDPVHTGSLRGQDIGKLIIILIVIVGILHATVLSFKGEGELPYQKWISASWEQVLKGGS